MKPGVLIGFATVFFLFGSMASAQSSLFTNLGANNPSGLPDGVDGLYAAAVDRATLAGNPATLDVLLPGYGTVTADRFDFIPREGFDGNGDPLPGTEPEELSFSWFGTSSDGFTVVLSATESCTAGSMIGPGGSYSLMLGTDPDSKIEHDHLLRETSGIVGEFDSPDAFSGWMPSLVGYNLLSAGVGVGQEDFPEVGVTTVGVVVGYTAQARDDAGSNNLAIRCLIQKTIDESNLGFTLSGTRVRLELRHAGLLTTFTESGLSSTDRNNLRVNAEGQGLRAMHGGDVLSVFVGNRATSGYSGIAYTQRKDCGDFSPIPGCDVGPSFAPWALHLVAVDRARDLPVVMHEASHNLGGEHHFVEGVGIPRDRASFPFAYAFEGPTFQTVLGGLSSKLRLIYLSSPLLSYQGTTLGVAGESHNAWVMDHLGMVVSHYYEPRGVNLFFDGFETGDLIAWSGADGAE